MAELDIIRNLAKEVLTVPTPSSDLDDSLWDRAQRLVLNVERIRQLPDLGNVNLQIDCFLLTAATYFSDAGLAQHLREENTAAVSEFSYTNSNRLLHLCSQVVTEQLSGLLEEATIEKINMIISESCGHFTNVTEAMVLSDARNLDDMGVVGIFNELRRLVAAGRGISDSLQIWQRKVDYRYWQALLREGFRFEAVRKIAAQRLAVAEYFMNQLKIENTAGDLEELTVEAL